MGFVILIVSVLGLWIIWKIFTDEDIKGILVLVALIALPVLVIISIMDKQDDKIKELIKIDGKTKMITSRDGSIRITDSPDYTSNPQVTTNRDGSIDIRMNINSDKVEDFFPGSVFSGKAKIQYIPIDEKRLLITITNTEAVRSISYYDFEGAKGRIKEFSYRNFFKVYSYSDNKVEIIPDLTINVAWVIITSKVNRVVNDRIKLSEVDYVVAP